MIVLSEELHAQAKQRSLSLFAGNFSAYIAHCITKDIESFNLTNSIGNNTVQNSQNVKIKSKTKK